MPQVCGFGHRDERSLTAGGPATSEGARDSADGCYGEPHCPRAGEERPIAGDDDDDTVSLESCGGGEMHGVIGAEWVGLGEVGGAADQCVVDW
jgi:hypothetical protein